jgi:hypothetical protein
MSLTYMISTKDSGTLAIATNARDVLVIAAQILNMPRVKLTLDDGNGAQPATAKSIKASVCGDHRAVFYLSNYYTAEPGEFRDVRVESFEANYLAG